MSKIIGIVGFMGSGKDTVADYLVNLHQFRRESFANSLKDSVAAVFGWPRDMLEGRTKQSRDWRETVDPWWAARLKKPNLTPRWVLQYWGTEVIRYGFHDDMWVASLENRLLKSTDDVIITDCRFPNEVSAIRKVGGKVIRVKRGPEPVWYKDAITIAKGEKQLGYRPAHKRLLHLGVHASEYSWVGSKFDAVLANDGSMDELYTQVETLLKSLEPSLPDATLVHEQLHTGN